MMTSASNDVRRSRHDGGCTGTPSASSLLATITLTLPLGSLLLGLPLERNAIG